MCHQASLPYCHLNVISLLSLQCHFPTIPSERHFPTISHHASVPYYHLNITPYYLTSLVCHPSVTFILSVISAPSLCHFTMSSQSHFPTVTSMSFSLLSLRNVTFLLLSERHFPTTLSERHFPTISHQASVPYCHFNITSLLSHLLFSIICQLSVTSASLYSYVISASFPYYLSPLHVISLLSPQCHFLTISSQCPFLCYLSVTKRHFLPVTLTSLPYYLSVIFLLSLIPVSFSAYPFSQY